MSTLFYIAFTYYALGSFCQTENTTAKSTYIKASYFRIVTRHVTRAALK